MFFKLKGMLSLITCNELTSDVTINLVTAEFCVPSKELVAVTTMVLTSPTVALQDALNVAMIDALESLSIVSLVAMNIGILPCITQKIGHININYFESTLY